MFQLSGFYCMGSYTRDLGFLRILPGVQGVNLRAPGFRILRFLLVQYLT